MKHTITLTIDTDTLGHVTDSHLAQCWHIAQANPAPSTGREAGELAESVGREIIRRWLASAPVELWCHQGNGYYWDIARQAGTWVNGVWQPNAS